jgi:prepilin-type N-terminal cleavage/methylation domain-containing protein
MARIAIGALYRGGALDLRQFDRGKGWSLLELLVVVGILSILAAIALPAIQRARAASNKAACAAKLKSMGLALQLHHDAFGVFPSNGGWDGTQWIWSTVGTRTYVTVNDLLTQTLFHWGVGDPAKKPTSQTGSWAYSLLPFIDQTTMHRNRIWTQPVSLFGCPERSRPLLQPVIDDANGEYSGGGWEWAKCDYAGNSFVIPNRPVCTRIANISDGASFTIAIGEKAVSPLNYATGTWFWDEPFFTGGSGGTQRNGKRIVRDDVNMGYSFRYNWGAAHVSGCQFAMADASIRLLTFDTASSVVTALLSPDNGDLE